MANSILSKITAIVNKHDPERLLCFGGGYNEHEYFPEIEKIYNFLFSNPKNPPEEGEFVFFCHAIFFYQFAPGTLADRDKYVISKSEAIEEMSKQIYRTYFR